MKRKMKKITSFALSAMMAAGGMSSLITNAAPNGTITDVTTNNTQSATIKGYTIGGEGYPVYSIDVYFDAAAKYCYNKGTYNSADQKYYVNENPTIGSPELGTTFTGGKIDLGTDGTSGKWLGFDGTQNLITVVNKSNAAVNCGVSDETNKTNSGSAAITVYNDTTTSANEWYSTVGLTATGGTGADSAWQYIDFNTDGAFETALTAADRTAKPFGINHTAVSGAVTMNAATTIPTVKAFYYSISGAPGANISTTQAGEEIGTITLTFNPVT